MKIIDMKGVVGSDTLCVMQDKDREFGVLASESYLSKKWKLKVAENIWQSTANNLVIPEGLVCDVRYNSNEFEIEEWFISTSRLKKDDKGMMYEEFSGKPIQAIKVTGTQPDSRYQWENGE